jgi:hypothetical protein
MRMRAMQAMIPVLVLILAASAQVPQGPCSAEKASWEKAREKSATENKKLDEAVALWSQVKADVSVLAQTLADAEADEAKAKATCVKAEQAQESCLSKGKECEAETKAADEALKAYKKAVAAVRAARDKWQKSLPDEAKAWTRVVERQKADQTALAELDKADDLYQACLDKAKR